MIVLGGQRSPQNSAHDEHQRFWPRVSEAAGGFENAETIVNTVVFVLSGTFPRGGRHFFAQPTNASRHRQHERLLGGGGEFRAAGLERTLPEHGAQPLSFRV